MEFLTSSSPLQIDAKNLYPCLATISVHPPAASDRSRRLSTGSYGSNDGDEANANALRRVISGNRRKSSFGDVAVTRPEAGVQRKFSFGGTGASSQAQTNYNANPNSTATGDDPKQQGTWYWRVNAGVTDTHLVLLPLTEGTGRLLTSPPAPLSHAIPSHASHAAAGKLTEGASTDPDDKGLLNKIKNLFHSQPSTSTASANADTGTGGAMKSSFETGSDLHANTAVATTHTDASGPIKEPVLDQSPTGEMLPSARANALGATNMDANAESGWPGVINGQKLGSIVIALGGVEKSKVVLGGGKKGEASWVTVPIVSHFSHFVNSMMDSGKNESLPKSGTIKFEFDKDWIGSKGEAELLHHYITKAISAMPERAAPEPVNLQLGGGHGHAHPHSQSQGFSEPFSGSGRQAGTTVLGEPALGSDIAPDSVDSSRSGKVGGE